MEHFHWVNIVEIGILITGIAIAIIAWRVAVRSNRIASVNLILEHFNHRTSESNAFYRGNGNSNEFNRWSGTVTPLIAGKQQFELLWNSHQKWLKTYSQDYFKDTSYLGLDTSIRSELWTQSSSNTVLQQQLNDLRDFYQLQHRKWD